MSSWLWLSPATFLILGAIFLPVIPKNIRNLALILLPVTLLTKLLYSAPASFLSWSFLGFDLSPFRVDSLSIVFATVFLITTIATFIYAQYEKKPFQFVIALFYIGCALGAVFAGDLFTLYIFWEGMAITSVFLILASKTKASEGAGFRYILVHVVGGLILLAGIILHYNDTGSLAFEQFTTHTLARWLILIGFLVNAAAVPFSSWLSDAYPESTIMGGVILSAFTSKTAIYTLIRGFAGWDILIELGILAAIFGVIYALLENNIRRICAFAIINQGGFMLVGIGIGTPLAITGATAHAFACVIYTALLWMSTGAVIAQTGKTKCTELGGLRSKMPKTFFAMFIGVLSISAFPLASGFTTKTITILAAEYAHLMGAWLLLEIASVGTFLFACVLLYQIFLKPAVDEQPVSEAPKSMLIGMGIMSALCLLIGIFPHFLYDMLPYQQTLLSLVPTQFGDIYIYHFTHVLTKLQLLGFALLGFLFLKKWFKKTDSELLDIDWLYRKGGRLFYRFVDSTLNRLNTKTDEVFRIKLMDKLWNSSQSVPKRYYPIGISALAGIVVFGVLILI